MRILDLALLTPDVAAQARFYAAGLGLPVEATGDRLTVKVGYSRLTFVPAAPDWSGLYHFAFNVPPDQFAAAKAWAARRVTLLRDAHGAGEFVFRSWDARALYFHDPAGNVVELIARQALPAASGAFGPTSLLGVSEIGLATEAVGLTVDSLRSALGLDVFRGSQSPDFVALGDGEGLLIVVQAGREWYPDTGQAAALAATAARLALNDGRQIELAGPPYEFGEAEWRGPRPPGTMSSPVEDENA